ncbi:MAG: DUF3841 domain-containing protein [Gemmatimonadota bacterium]|nr:DUF3841 domain-containing protein [Gemmatimonadota bacterium]
MKVYGEGEWKAIHTLQKTEIPQIMTLWTIQSIAVWKILQREKVLFADQRYSEVLFFDAYRWMVKQMERRIESESETTSLPLWAWYQWEGKRRKPDLRRSAHLPKGQCGVRIEFEQSDKGVLLSDFELWHYVLNYWYLPRNVADGEAFEAELSEHNLSFFEMKPLPVRAYHQRIEDSWDRIFDLDWTEEEISDPFSKKSIQATFWRLHLDQIRDVHFFTAR